VQISDDWANPVRDGGTDEEDGYMGLCEYFVNGENGPRSTYKQELISDNVTSEEQVMVSKAPEGRWGITRRRRRDGRSIIQRFSALPASGRQRPSISAPKVHQAPSPR
jgi:hypothetical protein